MKITTTLLFLLCAFYLQAQKDYTAVSPQTYIYEITAAEADSFYQKPYNKFQPKHWHFHSLRDSIIHRFPKQFKENGHFIFVSVKQEDVLFNLQSFSSLQTVVLQDKHDLSLKVFDNEGFSVTDADIYLENKNIPFDKKTKTYLLKKHYKGGFLIIKVKGETVFYKLTQQQRGWILVRKWRKFTYTPIGRIINKPYVKVRNIVRYISNYREYSSWGHLIPFYSLIQRISNKKDWKRGYVILNKPKYLPGDTVKIKAYLTNKKGKPLSKPQTFKFTDDSYSSSAKTYLSKEVIPTKKGNFTYEFVLGDSLKLDKGYRVDFGDKMMAYFDLEDYQLDEVSWDISSDKEEYESTDKVLLGLEGTDANGNTIPDGEVELTLRTTLVKNIVDSLVYVPDTLWTFNTFLKPRGKTEIIVPDSIFPAAEMTVDVHANFQNSNGELESKNLTFTISKESDYFKEKLTGNSFSAIYIKNKKVSKVQGTFSTYSKKGKLLSKEEVTFPFKKELMPIDYRYDLEVGKVKKSVFVKDFRSSIMVSGKMTQDSVFFYVQNPHGTQIQYSVNTEKKNISKGEISSPSFSLAYKNNNPDKAYFFMYNFVWAGEIRSSYEKIRGYKNKLNLSVEQAKKVLPGETSLVKIKVTDAKGKSAAKVNLTAAAINAQFEDDLHYKEPDVLYRSAEMPESYNKFSLSPHSNLSDRTKINKNWYNTFHLDSLFFYSQRFDAEAAMIHYDTIQNDTFAKNIAQFTPHLLENGISIPVYFVYCNRDLVWYHDTNDNVPFAFVGEPGYNTITLRTKEAEYRIDSVFLKKGYKAELFLDTKKTAQFLKNQQVKISVKNPYLSYQEKRLINKSIFQLSQNSNKNPIYLWQGERNIHILPPKYDKSIYKVGPFKQQKQLYFLQKNNFYHTFTYESDFRYIIEQGKEKLYHSPLIDMKKKKINLPDLKQVHLPGQTVHTQADIVTRKERKKSLTFGHVDFKDKRNGKIQVKLRIHKDTSLFFCLLENEALNMQYALSPKTNQIYNLPPGEYKISYYTYNGAMTQKSIYVKAHTTTWIDWSKPKFAKDSTALAEKLIGYQETRNAVKVNPDIFSFYDSKTTGIIGQVTEAGSEKTLDNIVVSAYSLGILIKKTVTDIDGKYRLSLPTGSYNLSLSNNIRGSKLNVISMYVNDNTLTVADWIYNKNKDNIYISKDGYTLEGVTVISYKVPLIEQDNTTMGTIITSEDIRNLPSKNINGIISQVAGAGYADEGESVSIRGSRSDGTYYYIDGIRVSGNVIPQSENIKFNDLSQVSLGTSGGYEIFGQVTDGETGEPILFGDVVVYRNGALVTGTQTDFDGNYRISGLPYGIFDVVFKYVGYADVKYEGVVSDVELNAELSGGVVLESVTVTAYSIPNSNRSIDFDADTETQEALTGTQLRTQFKDYAYWQPNLITDKNGEAYFTIRYPDNITSWKTYVLGMDKKRRGGVQTGNVKSFKPLMAQLATPRFLIEGDKTEIIGKSVNFTQDSFDIQTEFLMNEKSVQTEQSPISEALIESTEITAPSSDSLTLTYKLSTETYGDGEQRDIPVFPRGIEETIGDFHFLRGDTSLTLNFNPDFGGVNVYVESDALEVLLKDLKYLRNYRYGCNEQTASKLIALLLEKEIATQLNRPFEYEKEIRACLSILKTRQNENGTWGWWSGNPTNLWMTIYVLNALDRAHKAGYKSMTLDKGLRWMRSELHNLEGKQLLSCLDLFSNIGLNMDYEKELARLDSVNIPMFEHLTEVKIRQAQGLEYTLDSLQKYQRETIFGGIYWGTKSYDWQRNDLQLTLLAYEIYGKENKREKQVKILQFFMEKRGQHYGRRFGRNTFEIAQIVSLVLPQVLGESKTIGGTYNTFEIEGLTMRKFPFSLTQSPDKPLNFKKSGNGTLFFTAYQTQFNPTPKPKSDLFEVKTQLLQNNKKAEQLKQGEKAILEVTIDIKKEADYVMIEVPIPAGCSYGNKAQNQYRSVEVHREYFKEKTSIFCRRLKQGTYTFTIELEARFSGDYTLNPAKVEQMYFPVFYGQNEIQKVSIK